MTLSSGDTLPDADLMVMSESGPAVQRLSDLTKDRKVVIFGLPGAYTGTCSTAHVPSFIRNMDKLRGKGVDEVICVSVNDPFVMTAWGKDTGATEAGIRMLADPEASFTKAMGLDFTAPPAGLINRSKRYAMVVEKGEIRLLNIEDTPGVCDMSGGERILDEIA
ncbi:peroxiredoxin [Oceanomicrobium pacificus]|uniref:Glutathione-dependent peroxiredoxin n=1 Tax=Oceanomicrobium pacificus TaxID=2692916 RepID=A0A6B0U1B2_9RHOB|nr:peroxiredoxin [Oceanomicrobium pacificus]MXU64891.1 redoxin family protein [Oceanomicrobium pacificus]